MTSHIPSDKEERDRKLSHPRTLGWLGTSALAMGGSNQSLFLIGALIAGQGNIPGQGSAAIPLLLIGLVLSWMAAPGWTELILLYPNRVGGIASCCAEAFRPISPVLANLTGVCYWWGWVPTCGLTALLSASAIHGWYLPGIPIPALACTLVLFFMAVNLWGVRWVTRLAVPIATASAVLALLSGIIPVLSGKVDWHQAATFHLTVPFPGIFGKITSAMAGLYLIGFAAPAFEAAACHVGETVDPNRNVPRAMFASAAMATLYFAILPVIWLGTLGAKPLTGDLQTTLGPTFAPLLGSGARAAAIWFMMFNMFHGTLAPLAGAARTLSQLSEDGLLPRLLALRNRNDAPWVATVLTAGMAIAFLLAGDPVWMIAAANLTYLIGICLPNVAVWLLRRDDPERERPWRAPRGTIELGVVAAVVWGIATILGFEQFGLPTVLAGLALAYAGSTLYALRRWSDRRQAGEKGAVWSLHTKLTGAMLLVLALDGAGYLLAINHVGRQHIQLITALQDIFVVVALLTITVGLVLPGMVAHAAEELARRANSLATGTLADFSRAMEALGTGNLDAAHARIDVAPVIVRSRDEIGIMTASFNTMQLEIGRAVVGLDGAREGLRQAQNELQESNERYELAVQGSQDGLWDWEIITDTIYFSPRWKNMIGYEDTEIANHINEWKERIHLEDLESTLATLNEYLAGRISTYEVEFRMLHKDGDYRWILARGAALRDDEGIPYRLSGSHTDITERKRTESLIEWQAYHDALTRLPNRRLFYDRLEQALAVAKRKGSLCAVFFLDIDHFKQINDTLGHVCGDQLLREVTARLERCLWEEDTLARMGGDEFTILLPDLATPEQACAVAEKLLKTLSEPFALDGHELFVNASIGISMYPHDGVDIESLLKHADVALYRAKEQGRDRYQLFAEEMNARAYERLILRASLRKAVEREELVLFYQPQISLSTGEVIGVEALVRWRHPELGMVSPAEFIPLAEETGAILQIGEWVLREACRQGALWQREGRPLPISVNLSARQLRQNDFVDRVRAVLAETGIDVEGLILELTEGALIENKKAAAAVLEPLRGLGIRISVDDFGTGYSSLSYLSRLPLDELKIDRSFVTRLAESSQDQVVVKAVIEMAHGLGLEVVGEGVETEVQRSSLQRLGCDAMQGYLFSPPVPVEKLDALREAAAPQPRLRAA